MNKQEIFRRNIELLAMGPGIERPLPSVERLQEVMRLVKALLFPEFFDSEVYPVDLRRHFIGVNLERLFNALNAQISTVLPSDAEKYTLSFIDYLPTLRSELLTDVEAVFANDPAATNLGEVLFSYPVINAMIHYRAAHCLLSLGVPVIPRIITEMAHSATGIDIHPGAKIGTHFAIDHGTGVVIGQTCIIGKHVTLYQGVTLGSKNFTLDSQGHPLNIPRHPIIEDRVTIYSNASVLGRITVGHDAVIGGNVWVTEDVPPHARIVQHPRK